MSSLPVLTKTNAQNIFRAYANKINQGGGGGGGEQFQYTTMPTPSAQNEGKVYQYIGDTVGQFNGQNWYVPGEFYKCIQDENENYIWDSLMTQICDSDLSSFQFPDDLTEKCYFKYHGVSQSPAPRKLFIFMGGEYMDMTTSYFGFDEFPSVDHIPINEDFEEAGAEVLLSEIPGQKPKLFGRMDEETIIEITPEMMGWYCLEYALPADPEEFNTQLMQPMYVTSSNTFTSHDTELVDGGVYLKNRSDLYPFTNASGGGSSSDSIPVFNQYIPVPTMADILAAKVIQVVNADGTSIVSRGMYIKVYHPELNSGFEWEYFELSDPVILESPELPADADTKEVYAYLDQETGTAIVFCYCNSVEQWVRSELDPNNPFINGFPDLSNYELGSIIQVAFSSTSLIELGVLPPILTLRAKLDRETPSWEVISSGGGGSSLPDAENEGF